MTTVYSNDDITLILRDCRESMAAMDADSIDSIVCDPPYGLEFMGKDWDGADGFRRSLNEADVGRDNVFGRASRTSPEYRALHLFQEWCEAWAVEALRVLKPGGHLLAFGGTRTYHRMVCAIEDAGFEIRDSLHWIYGSGFPKSLDVAKQIDKDAGIWRGRAGDVTSTNGSMENPNRERSDKGEPATATAAAWWGWGTALKPSHEPIVVARKPLVGTVVGNVLVYGTGGLNIDGCRVGTDESLGRFNQAKPVAHNVSDSDPAARMLGRMQQSASVVDNSGGLGRWPPNLLLSHSAFCVPVGVRHVKGDGRVFDNRGTRPGGFVGTGSDVGGATPNGPVYMDETVAAWDCEPGCPVAELDRQSGFSRTTRTTTTRSPDGGGRTAYGSFAGQEIVEIGYDDEGGASRYFPQFGAPFQYVPKPAQSERSDGLGGGDVLSGGDATDRQDGSAGLSSPPAGAGRSGNGRNPHPTVKPVDLMRWLVRLVTPPGGVVLDPFLGSGTTAIAAWQENRTVVGIERDPVYMDVAVARVKAACARGVQQGFDFGAGPSVEDVPESDAL